MPDSHEEIPEETPGSRPLSRRASRRLVVIAIVLVLLISAGSVYLLTQMAGTPAQEEPVAPPDTADTTGPLPPPGQ